MNSRIVISLVLSLVLTGSLPAANVVFTGAVNNLWSNPDNWDLGRVPDAGDTARVQNGASCVLDYAAPPINQLNMRGGGSHLQLLDGAHLISNSWSVVSLNGGTADNRDVLEILGGVFDCHFHFRVADDGAALLVIDYDGVLNIHDVEFRVGYDVGGDGIVRLRGGSLNLLEGVNALPLVFRNGADSKAHMDFSGGVMTMAYSDERLAFINDHIADGTITAYYRFPVDIADYVFDIEDAVGTVVVETGDANDYIHVRGVHPLNPMPLDGIDVASGVMTLQWTVDPGTVVDVWFTDDVTKIYVSDPTARVITQQAVTSVQVNANANTRYYWAVDTYAPGATVPTWGPVFDFLALANFPPEVSAGEDVTTWIEDGSVTVTLSGTVNEAANTTWTVISEPDDPNSADAVIADATALDTTVTLSVVGEYVLQLEADDGEYQTTDTVTISVYNNSCEAAMSLPEFVAIPGDLNDDCKEDFVDFAIFADGWLQCNALDCGPGQ